MKSYKLKNENMLIIREARKEDASAYVDYLLQIGTETDFLTFGAGEMITSRHEQELMVESSAEADNRLLLLALVDNKIVGGVNFRGGVRPRVHHTGEAGITVLKEYWGLGIATELLMYLINWAKGSGIIRKINLRVRMDNHRAIDVYTRQGFLKEGVTTRDSFIDSVFYDSVCMGLQIN